MAVLEIFRRKKKIEEEKKKEIKEKIKPKIAKKPKEEKLIEVTPKAKPPKMRERKIGETYRILRTPQITEKATDLAKRNQYVFKVWPKANKVEIKKAIEGLYGVDVLDIKISKVPRKRRRLGRIRGWRKGYKKAIVKIKEGQKIEVLPR